MKLARLLFIPLVVILSSCDRPAASVDDSQPKDSGLPTGKNEVAPANQAKELAPKDNPLVARAHLPLPERLVGLRFISNKPAEKGFAPGPISEGYYFLDFGPGWLTWTHADVEDTCEFKMDKMGVFVATLNKEQVEGHFSATTGNLTWNGNSYRIYTDPPADPKFDKDVPPALTMIPGGVTINLESPRREVKMAGVGLGSLQVKTLGHHDGYCVFDYIPECEGGYSVFRHRLPIREKTATIKVDDQVQVTASFDTKESKLIRSGNLHFCPAMFRGWAQKSITGKLSTNIQDLIDGDGAVAGVGKTAKVRCMFYTDDKYVKLDDRFKQDRQISFAITDRDVVSFLDVAVEGMKAGGWRRAMGLASPAKYIREANEKIEKDKMVFLEVQLLSVE